MVCDMNSVVITIFLCVFPAIQPMAQSLDDLRNTLFGIEQQADRRTYMEAFDRTPVHQIDLEELELYRPEIIDADSKGNLAIFDYSQFKIFYFPNDFSGAYTTFGSGKGRGPDEFINPTDLKFDEKGNVWLIDPSQARLTIWSSNGDILKTVTPKPVIPERLAISQTSYGILSNSYRSEGLLYLFDRSTDQSFGFQQIDDSELRDDIFATSGFLSMNEERLVFAGFNIGFIRTYDEKGELITARKTIRDPGYQKANVTVDGNETTWTRPDKMTYATMALEVDDKYIYSLYLGKSKGWCRVIDVYLVSNGDYSHSIKLTNQAIDLMVSEDYFIIREYDAHTKRELISYYPKQDRYQD